MNKVICGHTADGNLGPLTCYLRPGHPGLHEETFRLRDGSLYRTNWGSDGLAPWATADRADGSLSDAPRVSRG